MRRRRVLEVEMNSAVDCLVRGPGAGEILFAVTGRREVYSATRRGYSVQERTARNAVAAAERLGYDVAISGPRSQPVREPAPVQNWTPETPAPGSESLLW